MITIPNKNKTKKKQNMKTIRKTYNILGSNNDLRMTKKTCNLWDEGNFDRIPPLAVPGRSCKAKIDIFNIATIDNSDVT